MATKPLPTAEKNARRDEEIIALVRTAVSDHREAIGRLADLDYDVSAFQRNRQKSISRLSDLLDERPDDRPWPEDFGEDFEALSQLEEELFVKAQQVIDEAPPAVAVHLAMADDAKKRRGK
jgi:uncharacterized protein involved in exopolysaccharide biosynthesis